MCIVFPEWRDVGLMAGCAGGGGLMQQTGLLTRGFGNELRIRVTTPVTSSLVGHIKLCCDSLLLHIPLQTLKASNLGS